MVTWRRVKQCVPCMSGNLLEPNSSPASPIGMATPALGEGTCRLYQSLPGSHAPHASGQALEVDGDIYTRPNRQYHRLRKYEEHIPGFRVPDDS